MKALLAIAALFVASSVTAGEFDGAWVLSGQWTGYMGLALQIHGDRYQYWFSSDSAPAIFSSTAIINGKTTTTSSSVEKPPQYPLRGRLRVRGDIIELLGPGDFYDRKWRRIVYRGVPSLLAEQHYREWKKSGRFADDRLLFRAPHFDEKHPRLNYGGLRSQKDQSLALHRHHRNDVQA